MRVLIVDDDDTCRKILRVALRGRGELAEAANGRAAVDAVCQSLIDGTPFDLITLDIMMPDMNGQAALIAIRALERLKGFGEGKGAKIVMTTALGDENAIRSAFRSQCEAYLVKPISIEKSNKLITDFNLT